MRKIPSDKQSQSPKKSLGDKVNQSNEKKIKKETLLLPGRTKDLELLTQTGTEENDLKRDHQLEKLLLGQKQLDDGLESLLYLIRTDSPLSTAAMVYLMAILLKPMEEIAQKALAGNAEVIELIWSAACYTTGIIEKIIDTYPEHITPLAIHQDVMPILYSHRKDRFRDPKTQAETVHLSEELLVNTKGRYQLASEATKIVHKILGSVGPRIKALQSLLEAGVFDDKQKVDDKLITTPLPDGGTLPPLQEMEPKHVDNQSLKKLEVFLKSNDLPDFITKTPIKRLEKSRESIDFWYKVIRPKIDEHFDKIKTENSNYFQSLLRSAGFKIPKAKALLHDACRQALESLAKPAGKNLT